MPNIRTMETLVNAGLLAEFRDPLAPNPTVTVEMLLGGVPNIVLYKRLLLPQLTLLHDAGTDYTDPATGLTHRTWRAAGVMVVTIGEGLAMTAKILTT
jgi:hypothetical protein